MKIKKIILIQAGFLAIVLTGIYFVYPKTELSVSGNSVKFDSINTDMIMISNNPDFSNSRYIELREIKEFSVTLKPGTYYWKPVNNLIQGFGNKIIIESEVGMKIERSQEETELVNIGNVKMNVTKGENGTMVGHIILEPDELEKIEDKGEYTGRQDNEN